MTDNRPANEYKGFPTAKRGRGNAIHLARGYGANAALCSAGNQNPNVWGIGIFDAPTCRTCLKNADAR